ncbi:hypothetical protein IFM89_033420 [Coptis chinensis]|uniref:Uncharacterized protein n=1 Tax=Coptis chinensis TaxID=261450 RepID=A0A835I187_9MAGN|nr:hypothetical protein IFM89_033420 [Coptis chinensis]
MASEKANAETMETYTSNDQAVVGERATNTYLGRAVAQRALFASYRRRIGSRKGLNNDARSLPSRLSNVSLADVHDC